MFLFWLLNDVLIDSEWKRFPAKELLPQLKPIYEVRRKTLCCDVELITRQTLTEFSRIREVTSRNRQRAHHSKAKKSIHFPTYLVNVLFYSCLLLFKVYLVHHLVKISIHFIFCQVCYMLIRVQKMHIPMNDPVQWWGRNQWGQGYRWPKINSKWITCAFLKS